MSKTLTRAHRLPSWLDAAEIPAVPRRLSVHSCHAIGGDKVKDKQTRPVLRYHGGKYRLAPWIVSHFTLHRTYVEPFCGAASVLMHKPRSYSEVINDLDENIVNLFAVLRNPGLSKDLVNMLRLTPFSRTEFRRAYEVTPDTLEAARRLIVRSFMGFGSAAHSKHYVTGFRANSNRSSTTPAHDWAHYPDAILAMTARLQGGRHRKSPGRRRDCKKRRGQNPALC